MGNKYKFLINIKSPLSIFEYYLKNKKIELDELFIAAYYNQLITTSDILSMINSNR